MNSHETLAKILPCTVRSEYNVRGISTRPVVQLLVKTVLRATMMTCYRADVFL